MLYVRHQVSETRTISRSHHVSFHPSDVRKGGHLRSERKCVHQLSQVIGYAQCRLIRCGWELFCCGAAGGVCVVRIAESRSLGRSRVNGIVWSSCSVSVKQRVVRIGKVCQRCRVAGVYLVKFCVRFQGLFRVIRYHTIAELHVGSGRGSQSAGQGPRAIGDRRSPRVRSLRTSTNERQERRRGEWGLSSDE